MSIPKARETGIADQVNYKVVEGWEQLPKGFAHRDVAGVAVDQEDRVFLICRGESPVIVYDRQGNFLRTWARVTSPCARMASTSSPGQFRLPHGIAVAADGRVFVCDREIDRIQIFSPDGEFLEQWTDTQRPTHLTFDAKGNVYVTELAWHVGDSSYSFGPVTRMRHARFGIFDPKGKLLARWGTPDCTAPGSFAAPHGLALDSENDLYVSEVTWTFAVSRGRAPEDCHTFLKFALVVLQADALNCA